mgnify:CR=1 FL=1
MAVKGRLTESRERVSRGRAGRRSPSSPGCFERSAWARAGPPPGPYGPWRSLHLRWRLSVPVAARSPTGVALSPPALDPTLAGTSPAAASTAASAAVSCAAPGAVSNATSGANSGATSGATSGVLQRVPPRSSLQCERVPGRGQCDRASFEVLGDSTRRDGSDPGLGFEVAEYDACTLGPACLRQGERSLHPHAGQAPQRARSGVLEVPRRGQPTRGVRACREFLSRAAFPRRRRRERAEQREGPRRLTPGGAPRLGPSARLARVHTSQTGAGPRSGARTRKKSALARDRQESSRPSRAAHGAGELAGNRVARSRAKARAGAQASSRNAAISSWLSNGSPSASAAAPPIAPLHAPSSK